MDTIGLVEGMGTEGYHGKGTGTNRLKLRRVGPTTVRQQGSIQV